MMKLKYSGLCSTTALLLMGVVQTTHAVENIDFSGYFTLKGTYADNTKSTGGLTAGYGSGYADE